MQTETPTASHFLPDSVWIEAHRLGVLQGVVEQMTTESEKRKRAAAFRRLVKLLKGLQIVPSGADVKRVGFAVNYLGQHGLLIEFLPFEQAVAVPGNYAEERKCTG